MPNLRPVLQILLLALVTPYLYDRYVALFPVVVANRPENFDNVRTFQRHEVKFKNQLKNCEDVILAKSLGIAFLSCDPGRDRWNTVMGSFRPEKDNSDHGGLWIYDYASPNLSDAKRLKPLLVDEPDLHPLGIAFDAGTSTLYVVNHSRHSPSHILILHLDRQTFTSTLVARLIHPLIHAPNSIQVIGENKIYVTNDHFIRAAASPLLSKAETFSGIAGGSVVYINTRYPKDAKVVALVPFANGITLLNQTTLAVASTSKTGVYLFGIQAEDALKLRTVVRTPASVDNLSVDGRGKILMAGHPYAPALMKVSKGRANCDVYGGLEEREACKCTAPSWVAEWSEAEGLKELYKDDGSEFCSSSSVVRDVDRGVGIVSGLYETGILVFQV